MSLEIAGADLPEVAAWERFLAEESPSGAIEPGGFEVPPEAGPLAFLPLEGGSRLGFVVPGTTLVRHGEAAEGYRSFLCEDLLPEVPYAGSAISSGLPRARRRFTTCSPTPCSRFTPPGFPGISRKFR